MEYQTIFTMKESEKATVVLAAVEGHVGPVVVKRLRGVNPDIYRLLCHAQNSHIPQVFQCEKEPDGVLIVEEYIDGENLEEYLQHNQLSDADKLDLALQLCEAVEFLHTMVPPVIHRDIKPSNILVTGKGVVKLIDFDASRRYREDNDGDTRLLGTAGYAPPEQFGYSQTDVRSDIYSMGVVFHEINLTGHKKLAELWEKITEKCTSFDPKNRYQTVEELKKEIEKLLLWKRAEKKRCFVKICVAVLLLLLITGGAILIWQQGKKQPVGNPISGTPSPTVVLTPTSAPAIQTEEPSKAPTEVPATPTPEPTSTPVPTATSIPSKAPVEVPVTPTPEPTKEPSPTPTEVPVTPIPTATSTPVPTSTEELRQKAALECNYIVENGKHLLVPYEFCRNFENFSHAVCTSLITGKTVEIPQSMIYLGEEYIRVLASFMTTLEQGTYKFSFVFNGIFEGTNICEITVRVIFENSEKVPAETKLLKKEQTIYSLYPGAFSNVLRDEAECYITSAYVLDRNGKEKILPDGWYGISEFNRVIMISGDFILPYFEDGKMTIYIVLDDGTTEKMEVTLVEGAPDRDTFVQGYVGIANQTRMYNYSQAFAEETDFIIEHSWDEQELVSAQCYCLKTKQTLEIPLELVDSGIGYFCVSREFMKTLDPLVYNFIFNHANGEITEKWARVYEEAVGGNSGSLFMSLPQQLATLSPGVKGILRQNAGCKLTGVCILNGAGEPEEIGQEWYQINCDGRLIFIEREYFNGYSVGEKVTLVFLFDDGREQQVKITMVK